MFKPGQNLIVIDHTGKPGKWFEKIKVVEPDPNERETYMFDNEYKVIQENGEETYWALDDAVNQGRISVEIIEGE